MFAMPDMPVARTSCFGRSVSVSPSRMMVTVHSWAALSNWAEVHSVLPQ